MDIGKINYWQHPSKTNCVFVDKRDSPLISIDIWCKAGISFEEDNKAGTAHFLEHMIFKGSNLLEPGEFDLRIESLGGLSNASTGYDDVHYYVDIPTSNLKEALHLLTNLVFLPSFERNAFDLEKEVIIEEIMQSYDQKDERIFNYFLKRVWLDNAYGKTILGEEENINKLTLIDLENFHKNYYISSKTCIAVAGKLPNNYLEIFNECNLNYIESTKVGIKENISKFKEIRVGREITYFEEIEFSRIFMAWLIPSSKEQKSILGLEILSSILSDGRNSLLNRNLKENEQLVESVYSGIYPGEYGGLFIIEASCQDNKIKKVENTINNIIDNLLGTNDFKDRLRKSIRIIKSNYIFNLETSSQLSCYLGSHLLWGRLNPHIELMKNLEYWENTNDLNKITSFLSKNKFTLIARRS
tara:strand:+ start:3121 stop:4362 length:1242 start_codon:yes stop_codon:yes gene_type:complete